LEQHEDALATIREAVRLRPQFALAHNGSAYALNQLGRSQEAIEEAQLALRYRTESKDDAVAYYNLGNSYNKLAQRAKSLDSFRQAIAAFRTVPKISADEYFYLGNAYLQVDQTAEAIQAFRESIRLRPGFSQPYLSLGIAYSTAGNKRAAMETYQSLKGIDTARAARLYKVINGR
jgi:tetratricopeptide (TPR) repeat protein